MTESFVVATAGHVDHGKSTLVRALTGMEPDRWAEERRRGLTIDLGFAWTRLPSGSQVAFVDVPGHERFLTNMLAGLGPTPVVCFVVAADEGWSAQSTDHRDAVAAFGIEHGLLVISRADRAPDRAPGRVQQTLQEARAELAGTGLAEAPAVVVSAKDGTGLDDLRSALDDVLAGVPAPDPDADVRLWVDRAFTITGAGTVVTGTLAEGSVARGDYLTLIGSGGQPREVTIRGLQSKGADHEYLAPVDRAALNLRGVAMDDVVRGDVLLTPGAWPLTVVVDVRRTGRIPWDQAPEQLTAHVGTAAIPARLRRFDPDHARITLDRPLPLVVGDRLLLHDPGARRVLGGAHVLDPDPPPLRRRGDGARRAAALAATDPGGNLIATLARHGAVERSALRRLGLSLPDPPPADITEIDQWWVHQPSYAQWRDQVRTIVETAHRQDPLAGGVSLGTLRNQLGHPAGRFLPRLVTDAGLEQADGRVRLPGSTTDLGTAEAPITALEARLTEHPFDAPRADELAALGLGTRELAAAERAGRLLLLDDTVVLLPTAPTLAMRELARLEQPFTTSTARQTLNTTRRAIIPLLEHLDHHGRTRRLDNHHREVAR
ncbi:selenocysteine-specific translation elongation factor [Nocardioides hungaricus]